MSVKIQDFENWLEERFIGMNEIDGMPITKDNCESLFEGYLENQDVSEMIEHADNYGKLMYIQGARDYIKERLDELNKKDVGDASAEEFQSKGQEIDLTQPH